MEPDIEYYIKLQAFCPICEEITTMSSKYEWLRDHFKCDKCGSLPRERALMDVLNRFYPNWRDLVIHESSPVMQGVSLKLLKECKQLIQSQYYVDSELKQSQPYGIYQDLQNLTFEGGCIDIHITQDVFEHISNPLAAFREIARTLRSGGAHIFTVPLVNKAGHSLSRVALNDNNELELKMPPIFHANPVCSEGSLVITDWGYDIVKTIYDACGLTTERIYIKNINLGILAEYIDVLITKK